MPILYVSADGDGIGALIGKARLEDDEAALRAANHRIIEGNQVFKRWAEENQGSVIEDGGDEILLAIPAEALAGLPEVRKQYHDVTGATVSVGVGVKISESSKALLYAKIHGKDQIRLYSEDMEEDLAKLKDKPEDQKIAEEYLGKVEAPQAPQAAAIQRPDKVQGEHSEAEVARDAFGGEDGMPAPEQTHAAKDFEQQMHDHAEESSQEDEKNEANTQEQIDGVKQQVAQALQLIRSQAPQLEELKQKSPETYKAIINLSTAVIGMARALNPNEAANLNKSEKVLRKAPTKEEIAASWANPVNPSYQWYGGEGTTEPLSDDYTTPEWRNYWRNPSKLLHPRFYHNDAMGHDNQPLEDYQKEGMINEVMRYPQELKPEDWSLALNHPMLHIGRQAAKSPQLPPHLLQEAFGHNTHAVRRGAAENPNASHQQLMESMLDDDYQVRNGAATNPNFDPLALIEHPDEGIKQTAFRAHAKNPKLLDALSQDPQHHDMFRHPEILENATPQHIDNILNTHIGKDLPKALFTDGPATKEQLNRMMELGPLYKGWIAHHPNASPEQLKNISDDENVPSEYRYEADDRMRAQDPDAFHTESVHVSHGLSKLRKLRDFMEENNLGEIHPNQAKGDFSAVRGPNGNLSLQKINEVIANASKTRYNVSHGDRWTGAQRHNDESSKVFQLNMTTDHMKKLNDLGAMGTFKKMHDASYQSGHPVTPHTIGWVRYTGTPETGIHVDEVQSDLGQQFSKQLAQEAHGRAVEEAGKKGLQGAEAEKYVTARKQELATKGASELPDNHWDAIKNVVFNGKPANEVVAEGFRQYLRDKGHVNTPIHMHSVETKGPISLPDYGKKPVPGHFKETYDKMPQKMGLEPAKYGDIKTQTNTRMSGKPTWADKVRKTEELVAKGDGDFAFVRDANKPKPPPTHVYRGITQDEHDYVRDNKHILSNQKYCVPGEGTCFGHDYDTAEGYVNFGHTSPDKTSKPTYVLEVGNGPEIKVDPRDGYHKTNSPIPSNRITRAWRFQSRANPEEGTWGEQGWQPKMQKDEPDLSKGKLPMPEVAAHHKVVLPPGSVVDHKVKVQHSDGGESWKEVGAGQIRSQDPNGHPVSALRPNSK